MYHCESKHHKIISNYGHCIKLFLELKFGRLEDMKQILYIHGGDSFTSEEAALAYWRDWEIENPFTHQKTKKWRESVREELADTHMLADPKMPNPMNAHYAMWSMWFEKYLPFLNDGVILIGHSLGANFLAKYLSENELPIRIAQLHLVAGCYGEGDFILTDSLEGVTQQVEKIFLYHSHDDDLVPFSDAQKYQKALSTATLQEFTDRGHFFAQEDFPELVANIRA